MEVYKSCVPCIKRQIIESARMSTDEEIIIQEVTANTDRVLEKYSEYSCTPELVYDIHRIVSDITGDSDPYRKIKERDIKAALELYPLLKVFLQENENGIECALNISVTGNVIDAAITKDIDINSVLFEELRKPFSINDSSIFKTKLLNASNVLIIADNSGETVFDRVLAERLSADIIYAVRSSPILNDATLDEAVESGLEGVVRIISSGCGAPGAVLDMCNAEFLEIFDKADIVISKGQGNYEALSDCSRDIFFLLKAKCPVIAEQLGASIGDHVLKYSKKG